jgi:hypothetical protein
MKVIFHMDIICGLQGDIRGSEDGIRETKMNIFKGHWPIERRMKMKSFLKLALVAIILLFLNQAASAQQVQMPQQGTTTYVTYFHIRILTTLNMGDVGSEDLRELVGITQNIDGQKFFDGMTVRCIQYEETLGRVVDYSGACVETDSDGDKVFSTYKRSGRLHTLVGGTGKYKGISGTGSYTGKKLSSPGEGYLAHIVELKLTWQFK